MKKLTILGTFILSSSALFSQYLYTDGTNSMSGNLNIIRQGYASIELKSETGAFIDFHSTINSDFDGRIIWNYDNNNRFTIYGNTRFNNHLTLLGNLESSSTSWIFNKGSQQNATIWITNPNSGPTSIGHYYIKAYDYWGAFLHFQGTGDGGNEKLHVTFDGNVGIGVDAPGAKLHVDGTIISEEVKVEVVGAPDYVFAPDYQLRSLEETQAYIAENQHLPEIPSAAEMEENGIELADMNMRLLKKIEELTLYQIELLEQLKAQTERIDELEKKVGN